MTAKKFGLNLQLRFIFPVIVILLVLGCSSVRDDAFLGTVLTESPKATDFSLIDHFEKVNDKDGAIMARRLSHEEGIMAGYSAGSAIAGINQMQAKLSKDDVVVVILHDHGTRYVGKLFNDDWMKEQGFM